jgi:hypothetical protein
MSNHQTIQIKIFNNSTPFSPTAASSGTIKLNMSLADSGVLRIVRYQARDLFSFPSPMFLSFTSGSFNTSPVINGSNNPNNISSSTEFVIPTIANVNSSWEFTTPIEIMSGDNLTNGSREINYSIRDSSGLPYGFGSIILVLDFVPASRYNAEIGTRQVKDKEYRELVTRNQRFFPFSSENVPHDGYVNY